MGGGPLLGKKGGDRRTRITRGNKAFFGGKRTGD